MSKLLKVRLEFDDKIMTLEGIEAYKWDSHNFELAMMAARRVGYQNPFDRDPVKWHEEPKRQLDKVEKKETRIVPDYIGEYPYTIKLDF